MLEHAIAYRFLMGRRLLALTTLFVLGLGASQAGALPPIQADPAPGVLLAEGGSLAAEAPATEAPQAPWADLNEVLEATRAKIEELTRTTGIVAAKTKLREEAQALKKDNERLSAELAQASRRQSELESARALAETRITELTKALEAARRESARLDEAHARLRRQNAQLNQSVTRARTAGEAAAAEAEKAQAELTQKLAEASEAAARSKAELTSLREELEAKRRALATVISAREEVEKRAIEMRAAAERSEAEAERLRTELAATKEQLDQAASATVEAERARQAASREADALRSEAARARKELVAARAEVESIKSAKAALEQEIAALHLHSRAATEAARQNLIIMAEKIGALNAALDSARAQEPAPPRSPQARPEPGADQPATTAPATSATPQPPAPKPASNADASQRLENAIKVAMVRLAAAPAEADSGLSRFRADIQALNDLELGATGSGLFSGIRLVGDHAVQVGTTAAWDSLPPVGQQSYLESLLGYWVAARDGDGPAVVRIVDQSGRVLVEKSAP
jgi:predicted  nucleic acid-binding Zn-ribbon protein